MSVALTLRDLDETLDRIYDRMTQKIESEYSSKVIKKIKEWWYTPEGLDITVHNIDGIVMTSYEDHLKLNISSEGVRIKTGRVTLDIINSIRVGCCRNIAESTDRLVVLNKTDWVSDYDTVMGHLYSAHEKKKTFHELRAAPCQPDEISKFMQVQFEVRYQVGGQPEYRYNRYFYDIQFVLKPGLPAPFDITSP